MSEKQNAGTIAATGTYYELKMFLPANMERTLYVKGKQIDVFHDKEQHRYQPSDGKRLQILAGFSVRVVRAWVTWEQDAQSDCPQTTGLPLS